MALRGHWVFCAMGCGQSAERPDGSRMPPGWFSVSVAERVPGIGYLTAKAKGIACPDCGGRLVKELTP